MRKSEHIFGKYFCGNEISKYGRENGYVDYATLSKSFDAVLCNNIFQTFPEELEQVNGIIDNSEEIEELENKIEELNDRVDDIRATDYEDENIKADLLEDLTEKINILETEKEELEEQEYNYPEVFQWYIISDNGANILKDYTNELVYYCETLDVYVWGVTHYGTSWDCVLTDIPCEKVKKEGEKA